MEYGKSDKEHKIQQWLTKLGSKMNINSPQKNKNTSELGRTEEEQRRPVIRSENIASGSVGVVKFWNLGQFQNVKDLINQYRQLEFIPEVSDAISQTVDECISLTAERPIALDLSRNKFLSLDNDLRLKLGYEFDAALSLLNFYENGDDLIKQFIIDGRLYFENVFNPANLKEGIVGMTLLNPKVVDFFYDENDKMYFNYLPYLEIGDYTWQNENVPHSVLYTEDNLSFVHSGVWDVNRETILGWLHPALKEALRLSLLEDSAVVYRLVRAPERRVYKIDIGKMGAKQAEEYVKKLMNEFRSRKVYDPDTGQLVTNQAYMNMMEDVWLPTTSDGKGTTVETLEGGQNLGEIADIEYFQQKLMKSLKVPRRRLDPEASYTYVSDSEINYEEYQFIKHIQKIRKRFGLLIVDIMRKNCYLKGILSKEAFNKIHFNFIWESDSKFDEVNAMKMLEKRISTLDSLGEYIGKFFSEQWVLKNVLKMSEAESKAMLTQIAKEAKERDAEGLDPAFTPEESGGSGVL